MSLRLHIILVIRPRSSQKKPQAKPDQESLTPFRIHCNTGKTKLTPLLLNPVQLSLYYPFGAAPSRMHRASLALLSSRDSGCEIGKLDRLEQACTETTASNPESLPSRRCVTCSQLRQRGLQAILHSRLCIGLPCSSNRNLETK